MKKLTADDGFSKIGLRLLAQDVAYPLFLRAFRHVRAARFEELTGMGCFVDEIGRCTCRNEHPVEKNFALAPSKPCAAFPHVELDSNAMVEQRLNILSAAWA